MASRAAVLSLYHRSLRAAHCSVEKERAWAVDYVRMRFRDALTAPLERCLRGGEEELARFNAALSKTGRLRNPELAATSDRSIQSNSIDPVADCSFRVRCPIQKWSVEDVLQWLQQTLDFSHSQLQPFRKHGVDGELLCALDDVDLESELGVASRVQRKRLLIAASKLCSEGQQLQ